MCYSITGRGCATGRLYVHLGLDERIELEKGLECGESLRRIAVRLDRSASTVSRKVRLGFL
ncbi:MAG: helix-turn-helix domain-containing protein [Propionibacteriaceae bacterium]|nr:helix-turn-helix domain-containing protein [Propionibacteriaceae bacterium]